MIKEVQYAGYSTEPSDYECADGQLALSLNLINEDNQLKPLFQPATKMTLTSGLQVVFIHKTTTYTHYIIYDALPIDDENSGIYPNALCWTDGEASSYTIDRESEEQPAGYLGLYTGLRSVNAIGNTLIVFTEKGMYYLLWTDGDYKYLGDHLPEVGISFGLIGHPRFFSQTDESKSTFSVTPDNVNVNGGLYSELSSDNKTKVTEQVMAKLNKFLAEQSVQKGRFALPFLVRYALRLYDGTLACHSAPVLMSPMTNAAYVVAATSVSENNDKGIYSDIQCEIMLVPSDLSYLTVNSDGISDWSDIVKSVDVFVSKPIYTWNQAGKIEYIQNLYTLEQPYACFHGALSLNGSSDPYIKGSCTLTQGGTSLIPATDLRKYYMRWKYTYLWELLRSTDRSRPTYAMKLPELEEDIETTIKSTSNFYKLASIDIEDLATERTKIDVAEDYLQSLTSREVMTDEYQSHDRLIASYSHVYNSRLNLSGVSRELFKGFTAETMFNYLNAEIGGWTVDDSTSEIAITLTSAVNAVPIDITTYIKENGETVKVSSTGKTYLINTITSYGCLLYYPNTNATKMVVAIGTNSNATEYTLKAHDFLNGAYALIDFNAKSYLDEEHVTPPDTSGSLPIVNSASKLYTSEVNNPFYFPVASINTIGTGTILGISSAAKALSQGQFGQFPLYAFTTEGVWALEVSSTGTYSAKQPITRDVCTNADGITQLDSAVLFPSDRGIMLISGSNAQCITDTIFAEEPFSVLDLPSFDQLHTKLGHEADTCLPIKPFLAFLAGCRMVYDYVHQRVFVFNPTTDTDGTPTYTYAYVYSLKSQRWGMVYSSLLSGLNSYPDALAMTHDNRLVSFSTTDETESKGLFVTRPLKFEAADVLKTISTLIQRGHFKRGDVATVLYASRDLYTWHLVWSSKDHYLRGFRGTPYKYFRIAGLTTLEDGKSLFGASVALEARHTNNLR